MSSPKRVPGQDQRADVRVNDVVYDGPDTGIGGVADHRNVGHEEQQTKLQPTAMVPGVRKEAEGECEATFEMQ